jgi:acyl carrier protein
MRGYCSIARGMFHRISTTSLEDRMATLDDLFPELRRFIAREYLDGNENGLELTTPLLQSGIIDSFGIIKLVEFIRDTFHVSIKSHDISAQNLENIQAIINLVNRSISK